MKKYFLVIAVSVGISSAVVFTADRIPTQKTIPASPLEKIALVNVPPSTDTSLSLCDDSLWQHVYNPQRLIQHGCATVTGTIVDATNGRQKDGVRHESDGDTHGWLKLDPQYENMLNAGNMSAENGNLVFEIVCYFPVKQEDAVSSCQGYHSPIVIPPMGSHVQMTGTFVQDTNHSKWNELHPISAITKIP